MKFAHTLRNYDKKKSGKGHFSRTDHHGSLHSDFHGICTDRRITGGVRTVWISLSNFDLCVVFYITAVYFRCGCGSGGVDWIGVGRTEHHSGFDRSTGGSSDADLFRGLVAVDLFLIESRKTGQLYFCTGYGWIYYGYLHDNYFDAGAETDGRNGRRWRISGTGRTYCRNGKNNQCSIRYPWCDFPCHFITIEKESCQNSRWQWY